MRDPNLRHEIEQSIKEINELRETFPPIPEDWELALELGKDEETGAPICSYYFVRHHTRCLFWLHDIDLNGILINMGGVTEDTHIREPVPVPGTRRTNRMTRPDVTIPILVGNDH